MLEIHYSESCLHNCPSLWANERVRLLIDSNRRLIIAQTYTRFFFFRTLEIL